MRRRWRNIGEEHENLLRLKVRCDVHSWDKKVADTVEVEEGILIDYGRDREIVGIEVIDASHRLKAMPLKEITVKFESP